MLIKYSINNIYTYLFNIVFNISEIANNKVFYYLEDFKY